VRLCAKSRETVASPVEHLTLHYIVKHLDTPDRSELRKLQQVRRTPAAIFPRFLPASIVSPD
jgi:hypothetical protein